jgi:PAS domain S-box-containing protein
LFNLIPSDFGRPLSDITHRLDYADLLSDAETVLEKLQSVEREVSSEDGRDFLLRLLPYRTADDRIQGVVVTFVNITERKRANEAKLYLASIVESSEDSMLTVDLNGTITSWNKASERLYGYPASEAVGKPLTMLTLPADLAEVLRNIEKIKRSRKVEIYDTIRVNKDGREMNLEVVLSPVKDASGAVIGVSTIARDVTERRLAVERLRESEEKYRTLFDSIDEGYCVIEMIFDEAGAAVDFRYLETNPIFERLTGLANAAGKLASEIIPNTENFWIETYGDVARTGEALRFENYHADTERWYSVFVSRVGEANSARLAIVFDDITERKRREANLALLAEIAADLSRLSTEEEIIRTVGAKLAAHLKLTCYHYVDVNEERAEVTIRHFWHALDVPYILGTYPLNGFVSPNGLASFRAGETSVINDIQNYLPGDAGAAAALKAGAAAQKIGACINVPYSQGGRWKAYFTVADSSSRQWARYEIELIQEVASRIFPRIERVRAEAALRNSEARLQLALAAAELGAFVWYMNEDRIKADARALAHFGFPPDAEATFAQSLARIFHPEDGLRYVKAIERASDPNGSRTLHEEFRIRRDGQERWMSVSAVTAFEGTQPVAVRMTGVLADITERKKAEEALRQSEERKTFLLGLTDALRSLSEPLQVLEEGLKRVGEYLDLDRVVYNEIDPEVTTYTTRVNYLKPGFSSVVGSLPMAPFRETVRDLEKGITYVQPDVERDDKLSETEKQACRDIQVQAFVTVPLVKKGQWVCNLVSHSGKPRRWTAHELTIMEESADRLWSAFERAKAEEAVRESEAKYRSLFDSIDEGFCLVETIFGEAGKAVDFRYLETNPAYKRQAGVEMAGKLLSEIVPNTEDTWFEIYSKVARTGEALRFENYHDGTKRWYSVFASRVGGEGSPLLAIVFDDITERKRREANLALLAEIAEDFSRLDSENAIMQSIGERLAKHLQLDGLAFAAIDEGRESVTVKYGWNASDVPVITGTYRFADYMTEEFSDTMRAGKTWVVNDTQNDERTDAKATAAIGVGAIINVPYHLRGEWQGCLTAMSRAARDWTADEIELIKEVSNRTFPRLERARAEEHLRETQNRLHLSLTGASLGTWTYNVKTEEFWADERAKLMHGYAVDEEIDFVKAGECVHPDDQERTRASFAAAIASHSRLSHEFRIVLPNGSQRWIASFAEFIEANDTFYGISQDITERKCTEQSLRKSEECLRIAVAAAEMATWDWNLLTNEVYWNKQHFLLFGLAPQPNPVRPEDFFACVYEADRPRVSARLQQAIDENTIFEAEFRVRLATGELRWMEGYGQAVEIIDNKVVRMSGVMSDITARKQDEEELRQAREELEEKVRQRTHELQAQISRRQEIEAEQHRLLQRVVRAQEEERRRISREMHDSLGQQLTALRLALDSLTNLYPSNASERLLDLQQMLKRLDSEVDFLAWELRPASLDELGLIPTLSAFVEEWGKQLKVAVEFHTNRMTEERLPYEIETNLYRIVQEALNNIAKHAQATQVSVLLKRLDGHILLIVEDNGVGFDPQQIASASVTDKGLGLISIRERAMLIGGNIEIESSLGKGATIFVRAPLSTTEK